MAPELTAREREFVEKYFKDAETPPAKMLFMGFSLMTAALILFVAAVVITSNDITVYKFKWVMMPGMIISTAVFIPGFVVFRRWRRQRELSRLYGIVNKLTAAAPAPEASPAE